MASSSPHVVIAGAGPSGLVAAILLGQRGVCTTVVERSSEPDQWSTKSYSIVLGDRGLAALKKAGCLSAAREKGMKRECIIFHSANGSTRVIPKKASEMSLGFSRPLLVECLESVASQQPNVNMVKGSGVKSVATKVSNDEEGDSVLEVILEDGSTLEATHVIGADGKWSAVRASFPDSFNVTIHTEPSFGVHIMVPAIPDNWRSDGTHVIQPSKEQKFYVIAAPIPSGELSVSIVCFDETLKQYPWLSPPDNVVDRTDGVGGWEDEYSARPENVLSDVVLSNKLAELLEAELPLFLSAIGRESLDTARINRRVSWVEMVNANEYDDVRFATSNGRVALIGDAAHAVTPSMGEGCNLALESAVAVIDALDGDKDITIDELTNAFLRYGKSRPQETEPIQRKAAAMSRLDARRG